VELLDFRPLKGQEPPLDIPERSRVLLRPTQESLANDVMRLARNGNITTDAEALELEAKILVSAACYHTISRLTWKTIATYITTSLFGSQPSSRPFGRRRPATGIETSS
jgi:hypothetical protein